MTAKYQVESLLRPAVELWSAALAMSMAGLLILLHQHLYMPLVIARSAGAVFVVYGLWRLIQGVRVVRYRRRLKRLPRYTIRRPRIPVSNRALFLGRGFEWKARHTQRLRDCARTESSRWMAEPKRLVFGREVAHRLDRAGFVHAAECLQADHLLNPFRPLPALGGKPEFHGVGLYEGEKEVHVPLEARIGHTLVLGTTGVGKTRLAELMVAQDIRRGDTTIVIDPKGDHELLATMHAACEQADRLSEFVVFHMAYPEHSARYNPIHNFSRITQVATRIANSLPGEGNSAAFREFAWRFSNVIAQALAAIGETPTYELIRRHVTNVDVLLVRYGEWWLSQHMADRWESLVEELQVVLRMPMDDPDRPREIPAMSGAERSHDIRAVCISRLLMDRLLHSEDPDPVTEGLLAAFRYERSYYDKITVSLAPFLEKLSTGAASELFSPDYEKKDPRPLFEWKEIVEKGGVVYVGLAALQDNVVASAVGNAMFADLTALAGELYAHGADANTPKPKEEKKTGWPTVSIHADEFNELIGDEFIPMLNKARGIGYQITAYTQTWSDVEARIQDRAKAQQIAGNFNTVIMMRVRNKETAELLCDMLPDVQVSQVTTVSTAQHQSDPGSARHFGSSVQDRVTSNDVSMLEPGDLTRLPIGQCFLLKQGAQLWKLRLPLVTVDDAHETPEIADLTRHMLREVEFEPVPADAPGTSSIPVAGSTTFDSVSPDRHASLDLVESEMKEREKAA